MLIEHEALRHHWYVVAEAHDLDAADDRATIPVGVRLLGADYVVWRSSNGELVAAPDRCPHRESPLSIGTVTDGCLTCAYHGWTFGDGGACVEVPSSGVGRPVPPKAHLPTVHVRERYGLVWICPGEPVADIPRVEAEDDPSYRRINSGVERWTTSVTRMTDNFLDIAHFPWVHTGTFGIQDQLTVPTIELEQLDDDFYGYRYDVEVANTAGAQSSGLDAPVISRRMTTGFQPAVHRAQHDPLRDRARPPDPAVLDADRRRHVVLHVRHLAQRRLLGAGRGGHRLRPGDRRGGQGDARTDPGHAAARSRSRRSACRPTSRRSNGAGNSRPCSGREAGRARLPRSERSWNEQAPRPSAADPADGGRASVRRADRQEALRTRVARVADRTVEDAAVDAGHGRPRGRRLRRPRRGGQGRCDPSLHRSPQPSPCTNGRPRGTERHRAGSVVLPAVRAAPADDRGDRAVRPLVVQPGRGRAGDGVLHERAVSDLLRAVARLRAQPGPVGDPPVQAVVHGVGRGAAAAVRGPQRTTR